jgi:protein TIF31
VTAIPTGFYVNQSITEPPNVKFDPSPDPDAPCFSHSLLDCLLQANESLRTAWQLALDSAKERATLPHSGGTPDSALQSLCRVAIRSDFDHYQRSESTGLEQLMIRPSWLVPLPPMANDEEDGWTKNQLHSFNPMRTEMDLSNDFGFDTNAGLQRDWNEELQLAREMPTSNTQQRVDRAR